MSVAFGGPGLASTAGAQSIRSIFDGTRYRNPSPVPDRGFSDFLRWRLTSDQGEWAEWTDSDPGEAPPERVDDGRLRVTFVNHATVLIQMDGVNILTDPIWSNRSSPVSWAGPERVRPPGIRFEDLPPIDAVVISHDHYDHLDVPSLRRLQDAHRPLFLAGLGNGELLSDEGCERNVEMDWWDVRSVADSVSITFVPARHFSGRMPFGMERTLWGGYVVEGPSGAVLFCGDTGWGPHFEEIANHFKLRLSIIPIGAFRPRWFMSPVHVSPAEAAKAHLTLESWRSVAIHFGTFRLGDDGQTEPLERLAKARRSVGIADDEFRALGFGEAWEVPPIGVDALPDTAATHTRAAGAARADR